MLDTSRENLLRVDDVRPILALIRTLKLSIDPGYAGECRRLFENAGTRINYYRARGMVRQKDGRELLRGLTLDEMGEALWDANFTTRRLSCNEMLDLLDQIFVPQPKGHARIRPAKREISRQERKARVNREKKFECPECRQIARGAKNTSLICGICFEIDGKIIAMKRVEPTAEEVLEMLTAGASELLTA